MNKVQFNTQEEEVGLKMLPSSFISDLQEGHQTYKGKSNISTKLAFTSEPVLRGAVWMQ